MLQEPSHLTVGVYCCFKKPQTKRLGSANYKLMSYRANEKNC